MPIVYAIICPVMEIRTKNIGGLTVTVLTLRDGSPVPAVYCFCGGTELREISALLGEARCALVGVDGADWDRDLTPWPAPAAFSGRDFSGNAESFLKLLKDRVIPETEAELGFAPVFRAAAGYSLAGLFTLWSLWRTPLFRRAASVSGSLWYDGFTDFMRAEPPAIVPERVYFSVGGKEKFMKDARMAAVESRIDEARTVMDALGAKTTFVKNPGGHFKNVPGRMAAGIRWLLENRIPDAI